MLKFLEDLTCKKNKKKSKDIIGKIHNGIVKILLKLTTKKITRPREKPSKCSDYMTLFKYKKGTSVKTNSKCHSVTIRKVVQVNVVSRLVEELPSYITNIEYLLNNIKTTKLNPGIY